MLNKNSGWFGAVLGLILPGITLFFAEILKKDMLVFGKDNVFYILCATANLLVAKYYFKSDNDGTAYGMLSSTFFCAFVFLITKLR